MSGGTGLIGKELGKALVAAGHQLILVSRNKETTRLLVPYPHQSVSWAELNQPVQEVQNVDAIVNLAGAGIADKRWSSKYKDVLLSSRKDSTEQLVVLAHYLKNRLKVFISTSAVGYYGHGKNKVMKEDSKPGQSFLSRLCHEWEKVLESLQSLKNVRTVVFRVGMVLSERGGALRKMTSIFQSSMAGTLGKGTQYVSWIDIQDLVRMYVFVLDHHIVGTFNAVAPTPVLSKEFTHSLAQTLGVSDLLPIPTFAIRLYMGEKADLVLHSQRVSCDKIRSAGFNFNFSRVQDSFLQRVLNVQSYENVLFFEQWLPVQKEKVFAFFSSPKNLEQITPAKFHLQVMQNSAKNLQLDSEVYLKFSAYYMFTFRSKLRVIRYNYPTVLVINQEDGPCKKWMNFYQFEELGEGVLIKNKINLRVSNVSKKACSHIEKVFDFRKKRLFEIFSQEKT